MTPRWSLLMVALLALSALGCRCEHGARAGPAAPRDRAATPADDAGETTRPRAPGTSPSPEDAGTLQAPSRREAPEDRPEAPRVTDDRDTDFPLLDDEDERHWATRRAGAAGAGACQRVRRNDGLSK